jgi:hypothetical protein
MDLNKLEMIEVDGIDYKDYPDFCDAYISYAEINGKEVTDAQYDEINDDRDFVYNQVLNHIY